MTGNHARPSIVTELADALYRSESDRRPIPPLTDRHPDLSLEDAYRVQRANIERRVRSGERIVGHKIGLTGEPMQKKFGVTEPDYGHLMASMQLDPGKAIDLDPLIDPQIEVEPAFVLGRPLAGPGLEVEDVIRATDYVVACYEIIDSRIIDWNIRLADTVADNGSSARFVLGERKVAPGDIALDDLDTELALDGKTVDRGNTRDILGHPARGIAWLGNKLSEFGITLEQGHVVLPGTCIRCFRLAGHRVVRGTIAGLGSMELQITGTPYVNGTG
jgi:2-keto-4-pentenoate hydratase